MKKIAIILAVIVLTSNLIASEDLKGIVNVSYFSPSDEVYRDIYGGGLMLGGEVSLPVWQNFEVWLGMNIFGRKGEMTYTKEEIKLKIFPLIAGVRYIYLLNEKVNIYGGLGAAYFFYNEEIPALGNISQGSLGVVMKAGGWIHLTEKIFVNVFVDYSSCKVNPADYDVNIGGIAIGIGLGYVI